MRKLRAAISACLPSFLATPLWRLRGARLERGAKIRLGSWIETETFAMGPGATIGPLTFVQAKTLRLGAAASLKPLSFSRSHTIEFGAHTRNSPTCIVMGTLHPRSRLVVGDHCRIFPFCWLEPGEGITIGNHVGVGGHSFVFSHGAWSDYLAGGPVRFEGVRIGNNVWLPWRVTVLAGATIGDDAIVMAGSIVSKALPANVIAGGSPAKVLKDRGPVPTVDERATRARALVEAYEAYRREAGTSVPTSSLLKICASDSDATALPKGSLAFFVTGSPSEEGRRRALANAVTVVDYPALRYDAASACAFEDFLDFLGNYGVRLSNGAFSVEPARETATALIAHRSPE